MAADGTSPQRPVAVVSGASSGIGAAVCETFAERGYAVVGLSRRGNPALDDAPEHANLVTDLRDPESVRAALESVAATTGDGVAAVVLNAGVSPRPDALAEVAWNTVAETFESNVATALNLVQRTIPLLRRNGSGSLTFVGASIANGFAPDRWAYAASKSAMTSLMRACSVECAGDGIVANEVRPGPVATAMTLGQRGSEVSERVFRLLNSEYPIDWLKPPSAVAEWIVSIAEFPRNGPTGQIFNYSRKVL